MEALLLEMKCIKTLFKINNNKKQSVRPAFKMVDPDEPDPLVFTARVVSPVTAPGWSV